MTQTTWVYPGDSLMDMVKRLMITYRQSLLDRDPEACERIDAQARSNPRLAALLPTFAVYDPDELVNDRDAAHLAELSPITIRKWASEGLIGRYTGEDGSRRYKLGEIYNVKQQRRHARAKHAG
jgi:hypothetical protein